MAVAESRIGKLEYVVPLLQFQEVTFSFLKMSALCACTCVVEEGVDPLGLEFQAVVSQLRKALAAGFLFVLTASAPETGKINT